MDESEKACFRRILVGVDLSSGDSLVSADLPPPSTEAVARAMRLAEANEAQLHFFFALDLGSRAQQLIEMTRGLADNVLDKSRQALKDLEAEAQGRGIRTRSSVVFGKSWLELIRQAVDDKSDLVVVGTRHLGRLQETLVGSTGMRLLRKCPCPVWITQPDVDSRLDRILIATDFSPACNLARQMAVSIAALYRAELYLLHVLDVPLDSHLGGLLHHRDEYHEHRDKIERESQIELDRQTALAAPHLPRPPRALLLHGEPSEVIKQQLAAHRIDLLVTGTVGRTGIPGLLMGNTAERLLPEVECSILAVKPPGYRSPVDA